MNASDADRSGTTMTVHCALYSLLEEELISSS
jgi:hypothetical protein